MSTTMLTYRKQVQAIADIIGGEEPVVPPSQLQYPFDYLNLHIEKFEPAQMTALDRQMLKSGAETAGQMALKTLSLQTDDEELQEAIEDILQAKAGYRPSFPKLSDIGEDLREIDYMWHGWVPQGYITILFGHGGAGKTYTAGKLAQAVIHNLPAPDGQQLRIANTRNVIHVDGEDFIRGYYYRMKKWGVNTDYITPFLVQDSYIDLGRPEFQDHLVHMVDAVRPSLITIDSLSTIHSRGELKRTDVGSVLNFLNRLAQYANCALVLLHHPRKPMNGAVPRPLVMHDLSGSGQLTIIPRSILGIDYIGDDLDGPRRLKVMKNNFTRHPRPIAFKLIPTNDPMVAQMQFGRLEDFLPRPDPTETEICADWLINKLQNEGPQVVNVLKRQVQVELGYNEGMLYRARKSLGNQVTDTLGKHLKGNKWALADDVDDDNDNKQSKTQTCADWLVDKLRNGPLPYNVLKKQAEVEWGFNESILQRARKQLGDIIEDTRGPRVKGNQWKLAQWYKDESL